MHIEDLETLAEPPAFLLTPLPENGGERLMYRHLWQNSAQTRSHLLKILAIAQDPRVKEELVSDHSLSPQWEAPFYYGLVLHDLGKAHRLDLVENGRRFTLAEHQIMDSHAFYTGGILRDALETTHPANFTEIVVGIATFHHGLELRDQSPQIQKLYKQQSERTKGFIEVAKVIDSISGLCEKRNYPQDEITDLVIKSNLIRCLGTIPCGLESIALFILKHHDEFQEAEDFSQNYQKYWTSDAAVCAVMR